MAVELPYWLMVPNCKIEINIREHRYNIDINDDFAELHFNPADDSRINCVYFGPAKVPSDVIEGLQESQRFVACRKCKTVLLINTRCNADAIKAHDEIGKRRSIARWYFRALYDAHIELINKLVQHYRLATYDLFVYELSPWDVPTWFVLREKEDFIRVPLLDYAELDCKPVVMQFKDRGNPHAQRETVKHIEPTGLQEALCLEPSTGEYEVLDAINLMIRGDCSSAVRRIATAIEAMLESALRAELLKLYPQAEVDQRLYASRNDFPGRLRQYEKLSGHELPAALFKQDEWIAIKTHWGSHGAFRIVPPTFTNKNIPRLDILSR